MLVLIVTSPVACGLSYTITIYNVHSCQFSTFLQDKKSEILIHLSQPKIQSFASISLKALKNTKGRNKKATTNRVSAMIESILFQLLLLPSLLPLSLPYAFLSLFQTFLLFLFGFLQVRERTHKQHQHIFVTQLFCCFQPRESLFGVCIGFHFRDSFVVISFVSFLWEVDLVCWHTMGEDNDNGSMCVDRTSKGRWSGSKKYAANAIVFFLEFHTQVYLLCLVQQWGFLFALPLPHPRLSLSPPWAKQSLMSLFLSVGWDSV